VKDAVEASDACLSVRRADDCFMAALSLLLCFSPEGFLPFGTGLPGCQMTGACVSGVA